MSEFWKYNNPIWREKYNAGAVTVDEKQLIEDFKADVKVKDYVFLRHKESGKISWHLNAKRGNDTYAKTWDKRLKLIFEGLSSKEWDVPSEWHPDFLPGKKYRDTFVLLSTVTIAQGVHSRMHAWKNISKWLHRFKTRSIQELEHIFGKGTVHFTVKEANEEGYPAPHILMIVNKPVTVVWHYSKTEREYRWIVKDRNVNATLKKIWYDITQSPVTDIRGVCGSSLGDSGTVAYYLTKYLGKSVNLDNKISVFTHAYQKFFRQRDQVSKSFLDRLGVGIPTKYNTRLVTYHNELQKIKRLKRLTTLINTTLTNQINLSHIETTLIRALQYYESMILQIKAGIPPPEWEYLDHFRVITSADMQILIDRIVAINLHNQTVSA